VGRMFSHQAHLRNLQALLGRLGLANTEARQPKGAW